MARYEKTYTRRLSVPMTEQEHAETVAISHAEKRPAAEITRELWKAYARKWRKKEVKE